MAHERATYGLWLFLRHRSRAIGQRNRFRDARSRPGGDGDGIPHCSARREFPAITILAGSASAATTPIGGLIRQRSGGTEEGTNDWKDFGEDEKAQEARRQERRRQCRNARTHRQRGRSHPGRRPRRLHPRLHLRYEGGQGDAQGAGTATNRPRPRTSSVWWSAAPSRSRTSAAR